jgi:hypothetical protein
MRKAHRHTDVDAQRQALRAFAGALVLALASLTTPVFGQGAGSAKPDAREAERASLYEEGLALAETGRWEEALRKFQAVVAIRSAPRALLALATAEEKSGRLVSAKRTYVKSRADAQAAGEKDVVQKATAAQEALEPRLPHVLIRLPAGTVGVEMTLDDAPQPATPEAVEVDPGEHRIVVRAPGMQPVEERFRLAERELKELVVKLNPVETSQPSEFSKPAFVPPRDRAVGFRRGPPLPAWILGGAGAAVTVVGVIVRQNAQGDYDDASAGCPDGHCSTPGDAERGNAARDRMLAGSLVATTGVLAVAGAGLWWVLSPTSPEQAKASPAARPSAIDQRGLFVRVEALPAGGGWLSLRGAF